MSDVGFVDVPTGRRLEETAMSIRTLPRASTKALERARRTRPESRDADYEVEGRLFIDKASGIAYRRVPGDPQAGGVGRDDISTWFVAGDELGDGIVYLLAADAPGSVVSQEVGTVGGYAEGPAR